jgi:hypothetical protein
MLKRDECGIHFRTLTIPNRKANLRQTGFLLNKKRDNTLNHCMLSEEKLDEIGTRLQHFL